MTEPYDQGLRSIAKSQAKELDIDYNEGIYAGFMGPYYETKAEIRMIIIAFEILLIKNKF